MTDSEEYREGKVKSTPRGSEIEPETVCLQAVGVSLEMTACLLHNEPASYSYVARLSLNYGAVGKPSLNRATK